MADTDPQLPTDDEVLIARMEALVKLETELAVAAKLFGSADDPAGRLGARMALVAIHRFLCAAQVPYASHGPVVALACGLEALDQGTTLPIVKVAPVGRGNRPVTASEWMARALAAAALELRYSELKKQGAERALDEAAGWIARETRNWPDLNPPGDVEEQPQKARKRVQKWRSEMKERASGDPMVDLFNFLIAPERKWTAAQLLASEPPVWGIRTQKSQ